MPFVAGYHRSYDTATGGDYLAVSPDIQRRGLGSQMMVAAEAALKKLGCPKINLQVRGSNTAVVEFYQHLGFVVEDRVSMGKLLE